MHEGHQPPTALFPPHAGILERGMVVKEYARDIDEKLRQAEMESIQVHSSCALCSRE